MSVLKYRVFVLVMNADSRQCSGGDKLEKKVNSCDSKKTPVCVENGTDNFV